MYENNFSRKTPGLMIIMVDQSKSMKNELYQGFKKAEATSLFVNALICALVSQNVCGIKIVERVNVVVVGYGGIDDSYEAQIIREGSLSKLWCDDSIPKISFKKTIPDGARGKIEIDVQLPEFVPPVAKGYKSLVNAFKLVEGIINTWIQNIDKDIDLSEYPAPVIVNITDGIAPDDNKNEFESFVRRILSIKLPDGTPLLCNIILSDDNHSGYIVNESENVLLFQVSSQIPEEIRMMWIGSDVPDAAKIERLCFKISKNHLCGYSHIWNIADRLISALLSRPCRCCRYRSRHLI